ncbi:hypothetical protein B0H40_000976 [Clostridium beijerinckii]|nr:hypothetical protein [Clostridium beijerinckii]NYB95758.1 hypothetical protein [Clostridium beijerinckii]
MVDEVDDVKRIQKDSIKRLIMMYVTEMNI